MVTGQADLGPNTCTGSVALDPVSVALVKPLVFPAGSANPSAGEWRMRYRFERCGESIIYNALFRVSAVGATTVFHLPPGTSKASTQLMQDLNPSLLMAASTRNGANKDCKLVAVTNTVVTTESTTVKIENEVLAGVWEERWTVRTCSGTFSMDLCFIPDKAGSGTTWTQSTCDPAQISTARAMNVRK